MSRVFVKIGTLVIFYEFRHEFLANLRVVGVPKGGKICVAYPV